MKFEKLRSSSGWIMLASLTLYMIHQTSNKSYSPDSWGYVDIARGFFSETRGVGDIQGTREYLNTPWKNDSFPFLWPLLISLGLRISDSPSVPIGAYLFIGIWLTNILIFRQTLRYFRLSPASAPFLGLILLAIPGYVPEGAAGRSIPLNLLLLTSAIYAILKMTRVESRKYIVAAGLLLGLCASNRFDSLLYGPLILFSAYITKLISRRDALIGGAIWSLFPVIWSIYSWLEFKLIYVADSSRVAISSAPRTITDWEIQKNRVALDYGEFASKLIDNFWLLTKVFLISYKIWALLVLIVLATTFVFFRRVSKSSFLGNFELMRSNQKTISGRQVKFLLISLVFLGSMQLMAMTFAGYPDVRYWISTLGLVFPLGMSVLSMFANKAKKDQFGDVVKMFVALNIFTLGSLGTHTALKEYQRPFDTSIGDQSVISCLNASNEVPIIPGMQAFRIPATTNLKAATPPGNSALMSRQDWHELREKFGITAWLNISENKDYDMPDAAEGVLVNSECAE